MKRFLLLAAVFMFAGKVMAQRFVVSVSQVDNKIKIAWQNPYGDSVVQINIQRSWDSAKNFRTIFAPLSPELPQNGYFDVNPGYLGQYYRIFYVLGDGTFFFTKAKKVSSGSDFTNDLNNAEIADKNFLVTIHDDDSVIAQLSYNGYKHFKDSIISNTRDTLYSLTDADVLLRYYNNGIRWVPSTDVFTNSDGYVQINLADALQNSYRLRVLDDAHKQLFTIPHITQTQLLLDKTDFLHAGWFYFELFENDKMKERNKFYIPKDF